MNQKQIEIEAQEETRNAKDSRSQRSYIPRVDIFEANDDVIVSADMPGVDDKSVEVTVEKNVLTIIGQVRREEPHGYERFYAESPAIQYKRTFTLSDQLDNQAIQAVVKNGVLTLLIPKKEEAKTRKIAVQAGS